MSRNTAAGFPSLILCALLLAAPAQAADYAVGPGHPYATPSDVPWEGLMPGDTVLIHWREAPYADKWVIGRSGTASQPLTVRGVPGPNGQLPVIDGNSARTRRELDYTGENRGVIKIGYSNIPADSTPSYIVIENLDIRGARTWHTFTDDGGGQAQYEDNAAAIWIEKGQHIVLRRNWLHDSGHGLFVSSGHTATSRAILVEGNQIFDNGNSGSSREHNVYTEALDITFQFNRFGRLKAGSSGNNLKDRSAGLIVRYNWIEGGNRQLDLVDSHNPEIAGSSNYSQTFVYGNVLVEPDGEGNRQIVMYGGDSGDQTTYRKGLLNFYNNTIVSYRGDRTTLFFLPTNDESANVWNNLVYAFAGGQTVSVMDTSGRLDLWNNWFQPGFVTTFSSLNGAVSGIGGSVVGSSPGFVNEAGGDFAIRAGSSAQDAGGPPSASAAGHAVGFQLPQSGGPATRPSDAVIDIGAFEVGSSSPLVETPAAAPPTPAPASPTPDPPASPDPDPPASPTPDPPASAPDPPASPEPDPPAPAPDPPASPEPDPPAPAPDPPATHPTPADPTPDSAPPPGPVPTPGPADLTITTMAMPTGAAGQTYDAVFQAAGGTQQYSWTITPQGVPPGLTLDSGSGRLAGTPEHSGIWVFGITISDGVSSATAWRAIVIE